ncbi:hypothetical protein AZ28_2058 [Bordetella pertussis B200]|nr:hypothetical protein AZ28_2058 [Bordetella pertussis B200]
MRLHPWLRRDRPRPGQPRTGRAGGAAAPGRRGACARHGPDPRHRAQPHGRPSGQSLVARGAARRSGQRLCRLVRHRLAPPRPDLARPGAAARAHLRRARRAGQRRDRAARRLRRHAGAACQRAGPAVGAGEPAHGRAAAAPWRNARPMACLAAGAGLPPGMVAQRGAGHQLAALLRDRRSGGRTGRTARGIRRRACTAPGAVPRGPDRWAAHRSCRWPGRARRLLPPPARRARAGRPGARRARPERRTLCGGGEDPRRQGDAAHRLAGPGHHRLRLHERSLGLAARRARRRAAGRVLARQCRHLATLARTIAADTSTVVAAPLRRRAAPLRRRAARAGAQPGRLARTARLGGRHRPCAHAMAGLLSRLPHLCRRRRRPGRRPGLAPDGADPRQRPPRPCPAGAAGRALPGSRRTHGGRAAPSGAAAPAATHPAPGGQGPRRYLVLPRRHPALAQRSRSRAGPVRAGRRRAAPQCGRARAPPSASLAGHRQPRPQARRGRARAPGGAERNAATMVRLGPAMAGRRRRQRRPARLGRPLHAAADPGGRLARRPRARRPGRHGRAVAARGRLAGQGPTRSQAAQQLDLSRPGLRNLVRALSARPGRRWRGAARRRRPGAPAGAGRTGQQPGPDRAAAGPARRAGSIPRL